MLELRKLSGDAQILSELNLKNVVCINNANTMQRLWPKTRDIVKMHVYILQHQ